MQAHGVSLRVFYGRIDTKMLTMKPNRSENNKNEKKRNRKIANWLWILAASQPGSDGRLDGVRSRVSASLPAATYYYHGQTQNTELSAEPL